MTLDDVRVVAFCGSFRFRETMEQVAGRLAVDDALAVLVSGVA